jgi:TatD DNase family protein
MLIDAHCHIDLCKATVREVVSGDILIISNGTDLQSNKKVIEYAKIFPNVRAALGLYPTEALKLSPKALKEVFQFIKDNKNKIVAVGEVGIDFYHITNLKEQKKEINVFKQVIELANEINKPLIVHSRKASKEALTLLKKAKVPVVMHCFEGNSTQTHEALERGYYFTVPSNFWTRKGFKKTAQRVPINKILTETDSPYLSPIEGENKPSNVRYAVKKLAEIKQIPENQIESQICNTFRKIFT